MLTKQNALAKNKRDMKNAPKQDDFGAEIPSSQAVSSTRDSKSDKQQQSTSKPQHTEAADAGSSSSRNADNPGQCTRLFIGNLSFKIEEDSLKEAIPGQSKSLT